MSKILLCALLSGLMFGIWPLYMSRSGLSGTTSTFLFVLILIAVVVPFALYQDIKLSEIYESKWQFGVVAGICGAIGLLLFNYTLSNSTKENVGQLFIVMIIVQVSIPTIYHLVVSKNLTWQTLTGLVLAAVASVLLTQSQVSDQTAKENVVQVNK